jgi:hypothetical protein
MLSAICCAVVGVALLLLGGLGIRSLAQAPADRIPLIYVSMMMGLVLVVYGALKLVFWSRRQRQLGPLSGSDGYFGPSIDGPSGHGGDCGHGDGGGGCGSDGGGGH